MADNAVQNVQFASNGSTAYGYLAVPESGSGPGVIVIQEWWGLVDHIADVCNRLAREGFVALAPDLFGGVTTHDPNEASELMQRLPVRQATTDLGGAIDYLLQHRAVTSSQVGAIGFCMGGGFVLVLAAQQGDRIGAAVPFYGVIPGEFPDFSRLSAPVLGHFGEDDEGVPPDTVRTLASAVEQQSGHTPEIHFYPAGHAFFNDQNPSSYAPRQAELAWSRTLDFLRDTLG